MEIEGRFTVKKALTKEYIFEDQEDNKQLRVYTSLKEGIWQHFKIDNIADAVLDQIKENDLVSIYFSIHIK